MYCSPLAARLLSPVPTYGAAALRRMQNAHCNRRPADARGLSRAEQSRPDPAAAAEGRTHSSLGRFCCLGFSARSAGGLVSLRSTWRGVRERVRGQIFSSTSDAHQREGAARVTHSRGGRSREGGRPARKQTTSMLRLNENVLKTKALSSWGDGGGFWQRCFRMKEKLNQELVR